jgi:hypothetical protein
VTLATRVRNEILKAMPKKFTTEKEDIFVMGYASRPVIHVKPKNADQRPMWLSFSYGLGRYGSCLLEVDYKKAGVAFMRQLEQNFVVLHDRAAHTDKRERPKAWRNAQLTNEVNLGSPRKRQRDERDPEPGNSKNEQKAAGSEA